MINNINPNNQIPYGAVKDIVPQELSQNLPQQLQDFAPEKAVEQNGFAQALKNVELTPLTFFSMFGIWGGLIAVGQVINKLYRGEWKDSLMGKIGALGDKINNKITALTGSFGVKAKNTVSSLGENIKNKIPFITTKTKPECSLAKFQQYGVTSFMTNDARVILDDMIQNSNDAKISKLFNGMKKDELKKLIDNVASDPKKNSKELEKLISMLAKNKDEKYRVKNLIKTKNFAIPNLPFLQREVTMGELSNKLTAVSQGFIDKAVAPNKTKLGKLLPKMQAMLQEGTTFSFATGKIFMLMQAFIIAQAVQRTLDAPKGEKVSTFVESIAYDLGFFLTLPLQVASAHIPGSMKYIGMGSNVKDQKIAVENYRNALKNINDNVDNMSHADYDKAVKELKEMLNHNITKDKKVPFWQKPFKAIGKLFSYGLEEPLPYKKDLTGASSGFSKLLKTIGYQKRWIGGGGRLVLGILVIAPFLAGLLAKGSHLIFGKPTKSVLDSAPETESEQNANGTNANANAVDPNEILKKYNMTEDDFIKKMGEHPEIIAKVQQDPELMKKFQENPFILIDLLAEAEKGQSATQSNAVQPNTTRKPNAVRSPMLDKMVQNDGVQNPFFNKPDYDMTANNTNSGGANIINAHTTYKEENLLKEPIRTYIPSSKPAIQGTLTPEQQLVVDNALRKADYAEQSAHRYI